MRAKNVTLKEKNTAYLPAGKYIRITVKDSGVGIDIKALDDIFTPYYSTKKKGQGLGLAISYSIVQKHNGHMVANSRVGRGTTVIFWLPVSEKKVERLVKTEPVKDLSPLRKKKILVMDDEDYIQRLGKQMLNSLGCKVECVASGEKR